MQSHPRNPAALVAWVAASLLLLGCSVSDPVGGDECGPNGACPDGYVCDPRSNRCLRSVSADGGPDARPAPDAGRDAAGLDAGADARLDAAGDGPAAADGATADAATGDAADDVPPTVTITAPHAGDSVGGGTMLRFTVNEPAARIDCAFQDGAFAACGEGSGGATPVPVLPDGTVTARVRAIDLAGNQGPAASVTFTLRTSVLVVSVLAPASACPGETIAFSASRAGVTFACRLDELAPAPCLSPFALPASLATGRHTLEVTGRAGGETASGSVAFDLDAALPVLTMGGVLPAPDAAGKVGPDGEVTFTSSKPVDARCALDGAAPVACGAAIRAGRFAFAGLTEAGNPHAVTVTVRDSCGREEQRRVALTVDATPPAPCLVSAATTGGPTTSAAGACLETLPTTGRAGSLTFSGEPGIYRCTLATAAATPCAPGQPLAFAGLSDLGEEGRRTSLVVDATDVHGNASRTVLDWRLDTTGPTVAIGDAAGDQERGRLSVAYTIASAADAAAGVTVLTCALDGQPCACDQAAATCAQVAAGAHRLAVVARDVYGNEGPRAGATRTMTYGPAAGRAILLGFDLDQPSGDASALLVAAVTDLPWLKSGAFARKPRVVLFQAGADPSETANVAAALADSVDPERSTTLSDPAPAALAEALRGRDVLVVLDQNDADAARAIGARWGGDATLRGFLEAGGVVVLLDGWSRVVDGVPELSDTWQVLGGGDSPILPVAGAISAAQRSWSYAAADGELLGTPRSDLFTVFAPAPADGTVAFFPAAGELARATYQASEGGDPVVEKIFPPYDLSLGGLAGTVPPGSSMTISTTLPAADVAALRCTVAVQECGNLHGCCGGPDPTASRCPCALLDAGARSYRLPSGSGSYRIEAQVLSPRRPLADPTSDAEPRPGSIVSTFIDVPRPTVSLHVGTAAGQFCFHGTAADGRALRFDQLAARSSDGVTSIELDETGPAGCPDPKDVAAAFRCLGANGGVAHIRVDGTDAEGNTGFAILFNQRVPGCTIF